MTYVLQNTANGMYYSGYVTAITRFPIANSLREDALEMDDEEIKQDFPKGLPAHWVKEPA